MEVEDSKSLLRAKIRAQRRARSAQAITTAGEKIAARVASLLPGVGVVAAFASQPTEPDMAPVLVALAEAGCEIRLPQLGSGLSRSWARYVPGEELSEQGPGRPPAPLGPTLGEESLAEVDLVLAPALAVDSRGNRLGQGGGWYDRALAHKRPDVPVYAVVFDEELLEGVLPIEPHDQPVDGVITPTGLRRF